MLRQYILRKLIKRSLNLDKPLAQVREDVQKLKIDKKKKETTYVEKVVIKDIECMWVIPEGCDTHRFVMYLHGGGYCLGVYDHTIQRAVDLAETLVMSVLLVDYPLAPENPFPSAINAVNRVYRSVSKDKQVALLGESSGCGLALNLMVHLREAQQEQPVCALMLTPFLDATYTSQSHVVMKDKDPFYVKKPYVVSDYYTASLDPKDPMVSPIFHDVHDLAPMLVHVAQYDTLADDGRKLYHKLLSVRGQVTYSMWKGMWHLFHTQQAILSEGKKAMNECKEFLHRQFDLVL